MTSSPVDKQVEVQVTHRHCVLFLSLGVNTVVAPLYLSEIAPINMRGSLGTLNQFGIVTGMLVGYLLGLKQVLLSIVIIVLQCFGIVMLSVLISLHYLYCVNLHLFKPLPCFKAKSHVSVVLIKLDRFHFPLI